MTIKQRVLARAYLAAPERIVRVARWVQKWWQFIVGSWLMTATVVLVVVSLNARQTEREQLALQQRQEQLAAAAKEQAEDIQRERSASLVKSCVKKNAANAKAHRDTDALLARQPSQVRGFAEPLANVLIDGLAAVENCDDLQRDRVKNR